MKNSTKLAVYAGIPIAIVIIIAASYKVWLRHLEQNSENTPLPDQGNHGQAEPEAKKETNFLPRTVDLGVRTINASSGEVTLNASGMIAVVSGNDGHIIRSLTADEYPDLYFDRAVFLDGNYFIPGEQKIVRLSGEGRLLATYTTANGLVNGFNLELGVDPFAAHSLWIETFDGISRLDTESNTFTNYTKEIGAQGVQFSIHTMRFTQDAVWAVVVASSASRGGVARFDRNSGTWSFWGPNSFGLFDRVDFNDFAVSNDHALATVDNNIFGFDRKTDGWKKIITVDQTQHYLHSIFITGHVAYVFQGSDLMSLDLSTSNPTLTAVAGIHSINNQLFSDTAFGLWYQNGDHELTQLLDGKPGKTLQLPDIDTVGDFMGTTRNAFYYRTKNGIVRYDLNSGKKFFWLTDPKQENQDGTIYTIKEAGNYVFIAASDIGGYGGGASTVLYRLNTTQPNDQKRVVIPDTFFETDRDFALDSEGQILTRTKAKPKAIEVFDWDSLTFKKSGFLWDTKKFTDIFETAPYGYFGETIINGVKIHTTPDTTTNSLSIELSSDKTATRTISIQMRPGLPSAFGYNEATGVNTILQDDTEPNTVWIATTRGIIKLNLSDTSYSVYWPGHGDNLASANVVSPAGENLIATTDRGIYILKKSDFK